MGGSFDGRMRGIAMAPAWTGMGSAWDPYWNCFAPDPYFLERSLLGVASGLLAPLSTAQCYFSKTLLLSSQY